MRCSLIKKVVLLGVFVNFVFCVPNVWCAPSYSNPSVEYRLLLDEKEFEKLQAKVTIDGEIDVNRLEVADLLHHAVLRGLSNAITFLVALGMDVNRFDYEGYTPLHRAAGEGRLDAVRALLEAGANVHIETQAGTYETTPVGRTAWQLAQGAQQGEIRTLLEEYDAEPENIEIIPTQTPNPFRYTARTIPGVPEFGVRRAVAVGGSACMTGCSGY